jgi:hypothetical protein
MHALALLRRKQIEQRLSISRYKGVEVNQLRDSVQGAVGHSGRNHTAVAVTD